MIQYSALYVTSFIRDLLRGMFAEYGGTRYLWDEDPRKSKLMIATMNDLHSEERVQLFPRVLIQRGAAVLQSQFLGDNLETRIGGGVPSGGTETYRQDVQGSINILIEAINEGMCEDIGEFCRRFICWSKPFIESTFGFQAFGKIIQMSECNLESEETEKFKISINIPYIIEDRWIKTGDLVRLNHVFTTMMDPQTNKQE